MGIFNFTEFITERLGVSEASLIFADFLSNRIEAQLISFYESDKKSLSEIDEVEYPLLRTHIKNVDLYSEFPVVGFEIDLSFTKVADSVFERDYGVDVGPGKSIAIGGAAAWFGNQNWKGYSKFVEPIKKVTDIGIIISFGLNATICESFDPENDKDNKQMVDGIHSTIYHELNHCYEHYVRTITPSDIIRPENRSFDTTVTWANANIWKFPTLIWKFWEEHFANFIYHSTPYEVRANVQEISYFIRKYPNEELSEFKITRTAKKMSDFKAEKFYQDLLKVISKYKPYVGQEENIAERLKMMWASAYKKECKGQKKAPIIGFKALDKMTCMDFLKYFERRINKAGDTIRRKSLKIKHDK